MNQVGHLSALINDPTSLGSIISEFGDNLQAATDTLLDPGGTATMAFFNNFVFGRIPGQLPAGTSPLITDLLKFTASPLSGVMMGAAGPFVSPFAALANSVQGTVDALTGDTPNLMGAIDNVMGIPANVANGFLNGATLDLDPVLGLVSGAGLLPEDLPITHLGIAFGGLLTPGEVGFANSGDIGGSLFNALDLQAKLGSLTIGIDGKAVGPIGALTATSQMLASVLGWDGSGNPLTELTLPALDPDSLVGSLFGGDGLLSFDLESLLPTDLLANLGGLGDAFGFLIGIPEMLLGMLTNAF